MKLQFSEQVSQALKNKSPIIALESTIITHGMDYPYNLQTALEVEETVQQQNCTAATIAIIKGEIWVGLSKDQLEYLAKEGQKCRKCSRRDIASCIAKQQSGSTTVAATMIIAKQAGIDIFVTGGIGGVHRNAETTFDISADLIELGQTNVTVVCAGAKSILDIKKTLEYLETQGVPVVGYKTEQFPAFFTADSGEKCSDSVNSQIEAAKLIYTQKQIQFKNGILLAVPIPQEQEANGSMIQKAIDQAIQDSIDQGIEGAKTTPFLLKRVSELTEGKSLQSNIALIKNNSKIGAQIAVEMAKLQ